MQMSIPNKLNHAALFAAVAMLATASCGEAFSSGASMAELLKPLKTAEERARLVEERDALPPRKVYYGKVVDTQGNPIPDAEVVLSWGEFINSLRGGDKAFEETLKTDENGCFRKKCSSVIYFRAHASKDGYVPEPSLRPGDFRNHPFHSEKDPVLIPLRKRGPLTFLIASPLTSKLPDNVFETDKTNNVSRPFDLLAWDSSRKWKDSATTNADLRINADFNSVGQCWNITYSITNGPGGIVMSDEMLYEAPANGYSPSVSASFANGYEQRKYLYVRSRTPSVYSRVMFVHGVSAGAGGVYLNVSCKAWVNPYGDRNLEYDERVDSAFFLADTLRKEALEAFAVGRYPEKPKDMGKLAEETRERVMREQEERNQRNREFQEQQRKLKEAKKK